MHRPSPKPGRVVCLVGFMGAGKTTVGGLLAVRLKCRFVDLDREVEARERAAVAEIFSRTGQAAFRNAENEALREVLALALKEKKPLVLALGGGAFVQPDNAARLEESQAITIFLSAPAEELWQRCQQAEDAGVRPLLKDFAGFQRLYDQRLPYYRKCQWTVETGGRSPEDVAAEIAARLAAS